MFKRRDTAFPLIMSGIIVIGLCSALIDGTVGWEVLAQAVMAGAIQ